MDEKSFVSSLERSLAEFDEDLYTAIWMAIIARRNLLVSSPDPPKTQDEIIRIIRNTWDIRDLAVVQCRPDDSFEDITPKLISGNGGCPIVILAGLDRCSEKLQSAIAEALRIGQFTFEGRTVTFPKEIFSVVCLIESRNNRERELAKPLMQRIWFRQPHIPESASLEPLSSSDTASTPDLRSPVLSLREKVSQVTIVPEIRRYLYDIIIFTRSHRMVVGGVATFVIRDLEAFMRTICVVNDYEFCTPAVVKLAAQKLLPMRIQVLKRASNEPTLQWGSDIKLVEEMLPRWTADYIVEDVLNHVQPPI